MHELLGASRLSEPNNGDGLVTAVGLQYSTVLEVLCCVRLCRNTRDKIREFRHWMSRAEMV